MIAADATSSSQSSCAHCGDLFHENQMVEVNRYPVCVECLQHLSKKVHASGRRVAAPRMQQRRLVKVVEGREIAGVCGGLADYCNMDRGTFRVVTIVGAAVTAIFPFVIIYLVLAFVLPVRDS